MQNVLSRPSEQAPPREIYMWTGGFLLLAALWFLLLRGQFQLLAALVIGGSILAVFRSNKVTAALMTIAYLFAMGDVRRIVAMVAPQPEFDPLLLIGPGMAMLLALPTLFRLRLRDNLSKAMLALLIVMILEIVNPAQGGLAVGLSGAFFYIVPVLWFWVGRSLASPEVVERLLFRILVPLSIAAAVLGLCQTFIGFLPYQQAWINLATRSYTALYVGTSIRAFGFSVSASEYATLLLFGFLITAVTFLVYRRAWILALPLLTTALVLASGRGVIVRSVVALSVVWVLRKGQRLKPSILISMLVLGVLSLVAVSVIASRLAPSDESASRPGTAAQDALSHQLTGLGHPFDKRYSTAGIHTDMALSAFTRGLTNPLGQGLGSTTFAAHKLFANPSQGSSEVDLSDMFSALGIVGGTIYLLIAFFILKSAVNYVQTTSLRVGLAVLAIVIVNFGDWLVGGQYSTSDVLFFLFGALVYQQNQPLVPSASALTKPQTFVGGAPQIPRLRSG